MDAPSALLDAIYAAAGAPDRLPAMLDALRQAFGCHFAGHLTQAHDRTRRHGVARGIGEAEYQAFLHKWHRANPLGRRAPVTRAGAVLRSSAIMPRGELVRTPMFTEFLQARGMHHGLRLDVWHTSRAAASVSLMRPWQGGDFSAAEAALAAWLLPHMQRAAAVSRQLRGADLMLRAAWAALDALRHPVLVLDTGRRVAHANVRAEALLAADDGLTCVDGALQAPGPAGRRLDAVLAQAAAGGRGSALTGALAGALTLPRPSGAPDLMLVAMPLPPDAEWDLPGHPAVLVCVADPALDARLPPGMLADLFGLTAAEAALASELLDGGDPAGIAARTGRSVATIRTHLARLMAKTGTVRQAELSRRLAALPSFPHKG